MSMTEVAGIFGLFGIVCAFYVSVVGFTITALAATAVIALLSTLAGGFLSGGEILASFVSLQVGYVLGLVASALISQLRGVSPKSSSRPMANDFNVHHE